MTDKQPDGYSNPFALWEAMMNFWLNAMLAGTQQSFNMSKFLFSPPPEDEREVEGDLDIPGPIEREGERNLHA
ncbi:MAG: hypothetical protein ACXIT4_10985 [Erythrobacter sp.]